MQIIFSRNFLGLILIALAIASPVAWLIMRNWVTGFAYQTTLPWWIFAVSGVGPMLLAFCIIGYQSVRAALQNPVNSEIANARHATILKRDFSGNFPSKI